MSRPAQLAPSGAAEGRGLTTTPVQDGSGARGVPFELRSGTTRLGALVLTQRR
jgi:hypothetical protein